MRRFQELERLISELESRAVGRREFLRTAAMGLGLSAATPLLDIRQKGQIEESFDRAGRTPLHSRKRPGQASWLSHPPHRVLPAPSARPFDESSRDFYIAPDGDDTRGNGSVARPWRSWGKARTVLSPGDTLYMRGGVYFMYGGLNFSKSGTARRPITIRAYPNELPIVTAALPEFYHDPDVAWEPVPRAEGGVEEEYRGFRDYDLSSHRQNTLGGIFPDSFIPLMRPSKLTDFRSQNEYYLIGAPDHPDGLWLGPCAQWNPDDRKIHVRLSHTNRYWLDHTDYLGTGTSFTTNNYKGETDPRRIPLLICPWRTDKAMLKLTGSHLRILDIVFCATYGAECGGANLLYDGVWYYANEGGFHSFGNDIRFTNCKLRGIATPWSGRFLDKYHTTSPYLISFDRGTNIEIDHSEITDTHDGILFSNTDQQNVDFHHNLVSNCNDDGIWQVPRQNAIKRIYQNHFQMILSQLPFRDGPHVAKENPGEGTFVYRNLFDMRPLIANNAPPATNPTAEGVYSEPNNLVMEHADYVQYPGFYFYQNTILARRPPSGDLYACGTVRNFADSIRRVYNNIFLQLQGALSQRIPAQEGDLAFGHNLLWSMKSIASSKFPTDVHANPAFVAFSPNWRDPHDLHLQDSSPCRGAGIEIPVAWPDPLRDQEVDSAHPDIGAVPYGFAGTVWGPGADI